MAERVSLQDLSSSCNLPKECELVNVEKRHVSTNTVFMRCLLSDSTRLRFNKTNVKSCQKSFMNGIRIFIRPKRERSILLEKEMIDFKDIVGFLQQINNSIALAMLFQFFKGFDIDLYDSSIEINNKEQYLPEKNMQFEFVENVFDFFQAKKRLNTCHDFISVTNSTNPRSIFQFGSKISNLKFELLYNPTNIICPLVFKNFNAYQFKIYGENSYFSKKSHYFSNDSFKDLNSKIEILAISVTNVELNMNFLHPDVFKEVKIFYILDLVKEIHSDAFINLNNVFSIRIFSRYFRRLMHNSGIEWIKNYNKDVNCNLENSAELHYQMNKIKFIELHCFVLYSLTLIEIFPDEDFCLYKDFPINQLVVIMDMCYGEEHNLNRKISCTYIWITRSYKYILPKLTYKYEAMNRLLTSEEYNKTISTCDFQNRLDLCNKTNFIAKHISSYFELGEAMKMTKIVLNIVSYILSIFGIVTNLLIIITISHKQNKADFKEYKQYDYLRLNSIFNCFILLIHLISWLNECNYPFQVFCPVIRKVVFMQYFKIIIEEVLMYALKFMNNFTYTGFAFNRISLIGKDHNKLVKFMSDIAIWKYIGVTSILSVGLSIVKFFEFDINKGQMVYSYPLSYEEYNFHVDIVPSNPTLYIINLISDIFNYAVFLIVHFIIDIGMIVKLKQTLNEKLEKSKAYCTKEQQEKKSIESESVLNKARSMIICNTSLNIFFKLPSTLFTIFNLFFIQYDFNPENFWKYPRFVEFYHDICINGYVCETLFYFSNFLYFFYIFIQLFIYIHYDKKFALAFIHLFI